LCAPVAFKFPAKKPAGKSRPDHGSKMKSAAWLQAADFILG